MNKWSNSKLSYLVDIRVSNVDKKIYPNKKRVTLCNYMDAYSNDYINSSLNFSEGSADINELNRFSLIPNDVIITKDSETPEDIAVSSVVVEEIDNLVCGYHLAILRPKENKVFGPFLMHKLKLPQVQKYFFRIASGSTRYGLTIGGIENTVLSHPQFPQQRKIARILTTVDNIIEKTETAIAKYKAIKQGMMHDLFTRGIDVKTGKLRPCFEGAPELYKSTDLGKIPKEWEVESVGSLSVRVGSGITPRGGSNIYLNTGVTFLRSQNIRFSGLDLNDVAFISQHIHKIMANSEIFSFDVLINITGASIGRCCYVPDNFGLANTNQHVCCIRMENPNEEDSKFLSSVLSSPIGQNQIFCLNAGGNREGLNYEQLKSFLIPWPKKNERRKASMKLFKIDELLKKEIISLDKYKIIKQGLMQDLLTGRKEVAPDPEDMETKDN